MKAKKLNLLFLVFTSHILVAEIMHHTLISTTEQKVMNHFFKHVMISGNAEKDEFSIDGRAVNQNVYEQELEKMQKKEREEESARQVATRRSRIQFAEMVQTEVAAKLLNKVVDQVVQLLERVQNPALEKFFIFTDITIHSHEQLMQLKSFSQQLEFSIQRKISEHDIDGLHALYNKLEHWPSRLEKFFQDTLQNAIKKSDDTMMLKELLKLVSEPSCIY